MSREPLSAPAAAEMRAVRDGVVLDDRVAADRLDLTGEDRVRFLHNLITCEVRELAVGGSVRGFLTHVRGGVLSDVEVIACDERLRLLLPVGRGGAIRDHLERHRIVERVEIEPRPDLVSIRLRGARATELLALLGLEEPAPGRGALFEIDGRRGHLRRPARGRGPRFDLELALGDRDGVVAAVLRAGAGIGLVELSDAGRECARVEDGELLWGVDYGEENFPQETGEEEAVSYSKGCYLGQEVVARIHYRGGVQRLPRRLRAAPGPVPERGEELLFEGRAVGRLTSLVVEPASARSLALSLIHRRAAEAGTQLTTATGARLVVLPTAAS